MVSVLNLIIIGEFINMCDRCVELKFDKMKMCEIFIFTIKTCSCYVVNFIFDILKTLSV